jgi:transketolase
MRKEFAALLYQMMSTNENIILLTGDLGYGMFDNIRRDFGDRFVNVGSAEQLLIGVGIGLSYTGKIPVCYSITPFLLGRPFEMIRNYVNHEKVPVKLIGGGRDQDYSHDGFTHHANDDMDILYSFENIVKVKSDIFDENELRNHILSQNPVYINLKRF